MTTYTYRYIMEINYVSNCPIHNFLDLAINQNVKGLSHDTFNKITQFECASYYMIFMLCVHSLYL